VCVCERERVCMCERAFPLLSAPLPGSVCVCVRVCVSVYTSRRGLRALFGRVPPTPITQKKYVYIYMYACTNINIYISTYLHIYMYTCVCVYTRVCVSVLYLGGGLTRALFGRVPPTPITQYV